MSDINAGGNVLGLEPNKYVKINYLILLTAAVLGVISSLLWALTIPTGLGGIMNLLSVLGLIMAVVGWLAFKEKFNALELNHLKYICVLFLAFFVVGLILGAALFAAPMGMSVILLIVGAAQVLLLFTGYNSYQHGRTITKDSVQSEVKAALSRS